LNEYEPIQRPPTPRAMVAIIDATKVGMDWLLVVRDPHAKENVYADYFLSETTSSYQSAQETLLDAGFTFSAIVCDGRFITVSGLFKDVPIQMCHYHQTQIIIKYLTRNPKLHPGIELLDLVRTLPHADEESFIDAFKLWCTTWDSFLKEKTIDEKTGHWHWTHNRLRQARTSVQVHLPYLFTFRRHPELNIPNTTNSLDGSFKKVKTGLAVHSGLSHSHQKKLAISLLFAR
jgi:hypothetical protein